MIFDFLLFGLVAVVLFQLIYYIFIFGKFGFTKPAILTNKNIPISVIVCAKNEAENIKKFVPLLLDQEYPTFELVLIDNASSDEPRDLFEAFEKQALWAIDVGRSKISSKLIINWIRWNEFLRTGDKNFKINDAYQSYYSRHFIEKYPQHSDRFDFRKLRNEEKGQYMKVSEEGNLSFL
jgi:glycosyltransferase involved in cell wall biosynthesis